MPDNLQDRGPADRARVNVNEDHEVIYWTHKFKCTPEQLHAAVAKVGVMVEDVERELITNSTNIA
jgi:hypothetical protein